MFKKIIYIILVIFSIMQVSCKPTTAKKSQLKSKVKTSSDDQTLREDSSSDSISDDSDQMSQESSSASDYQSAENPRSDNSSDSYNPNQITNVDATNSSPTTQTSSSTSTLSKTSSNTNSSTSTSTIQTTNTNSVTNTVANIPTVANPSFEADVFPVFPGKLSLPESSDQPAGNPTSITGWTWKASASYFSAVGINPVKSPPYTPPGGPYSWNDGPFFDNGHTDFGNKVVLIQGSGTLSQNISGFTVGKNYRVVFYENSRSDGAASLEVKVAGSTVVDLHSVSPAAAGTTKSFAKVTSKTFLASASSAELMFIVTTPKDSYLTLLLDNVSFEAVP